jgi:PEP-CTERM motif
MVRLFVRLLSGGVLTAALCCAGVINSFHVELGNWNGTSFNADGSDWNTFNGGNWAVGATAPGFGNPVLDGFNSVNLADGEYYLYMATNSDSTATAIRITVGYSGGGVATEVFTDPSGAANAGNYTLVSGSGFTADLVTGPQNAHTTVGSGQRYFSTGEANWVVDFNSGAVAPEPGSLTLLAVGLVSFGLARRKKS